MDIQQRALAGTLESSDCMVVVVPDTRLSIEIDSIVQKQFGKHIYQLVSDMLKVAGVTSGSFKIKDQGALDCVIEARVETVLRRAAKKVSA